MKSSAPSMQGNRAGARQPHLSLGQRLALLSEARQSAAAAEEICARHGLAPGTLESWRADFERHNIHEIDLADLRAEHCCPAISEEENQLLHRVQLLRQALLCKSAEYRVLHDALKPGNANVVRRTAAHPGFASS